MDIFVTSLS